MWNYINLKRFCTGNKTINRMKRQSIERGKIFANYMSDELISKIHKECMQHNSNNNNNNNLI